MNSKTTDMKPNTKLIKVFDKHENFLGYEIIDVRLDKHDINKLLNSKYPWKWEYYE